MLCADLCFSNSFALYAYDTIVHQILPNIIIVGFSIGLFIRICWQKRHAGQSLTWRKHWKMALQLLFVSANYLIFGLPLTLMSVFYLCAVPLYVTAKFTQYASFFIGLLVRIRWQRRRIGQSLTWRKHWKMTLQLLFISVIYLIFALPLTLISLLYLCGIPLYVTAKYTEYAQFLDYCTIILCPIVSAFSLPRLRNQKNNILPIRRRARAVAAIT
ncbi:unnamed protein product [Rotaria sp. Silwood2]|nr:unnamed protein product [Rotaria sp. Silwood2]